MSNYVNKLTLIAEEIFRCKRCDEVGINVNHCSGPMVRGTGRSVFVIGEEPGRTEIASARAFSGPAGKKLLEWLKSAGLGQDTASIFSGAYFTSLCKCNTDSLSRSFMICRPFLEKQLKIVKPKICVTLGANPLAYLFDNHKPLEAVVGSMWEEKDFHNPSVQVLPTGCKILPLPHPSPSNRWLNKAEHRQLVDQAMAVLRRELT
jgi:DNA polymerase